MNNNISYSSLRNFVECPYSFYLGKILNKAEDNNNLYPILGGYIHKIIEEGQSNSEMVENFKNFLNEKLQDGKHYFVKSKPTLNEKIKINYEKNILHFLENFEQIKHIKRNPELFFNINIDNFFLRGRIDEILKLEDGSYLIIDYKTSSLKEEITDLDKYQLLIYSLYLNEILNIPFDKIKCCYNFLKYAKVTIDGQEIITERKDIIDNIKPYLKEKLKKILKNIEDYEIDLLIAYYKEGFSSNEIDKILKEEVTIKDYLYFVPIEENISSCIKFIKEQANKIMGKSDNETDWERKPIGTNEIFKCENFCNVANSCKYLKDYYSKNKF